jgi:hypothetical protein
MYNLHSTWLAGAVSTAALYVRSTLYLACWSREYSRPLGDHGRTRERNILHSENAVAGVNGYVDGGKVTLGVGPECRKRRRDKSERVRASQSKSEQVRASQSKSERVRANGMGI